MNIKCKCGKEFDWKDRVEDDSRLLCPKCLEEFGRTDG